MINDLLDIALDMHRKLRSETDLDVLDLHVDNERQRYIGIKVAGGPAEIDAVAEALGLDTEAYRSETFHLGSKTVSLLEDFYPDGVDLLRVVARRPMTPVEIAEHEGGEPS